MFNYSKSKALYFEEKFFNKVNQIGQKIIRYKNDEIKKRNKTIDNLHDELDHERLKNDELIEENKRLKEKNRDIENDIERLKKELDLKTIQINRNSSNSN
jgi:cell shape-determining protein MreC